MNDTILAGRMQVGVYKTTPTSVLPKRATEYSACFDVCANLVNRELKAYTKNIRAGYSIKGTVSDHGNSITLLPGNRVLVPTGLKFNIPHHSCLKLYPRSGISYNQGLTLINNVGIVDSDYVDELFVPIINLSDTEQTIVDGERIAQLEVCKVEQFVEFVKSDTDYSQKTDRTGGFGSTGKV